MVAAQRARPGRNDLCACGSGRKYKKCCGPAAAERDAALPVAQWQELAVLADAGRHEELEARARELLLRHPTSGATAKVLALALWAQGKDALQLLERAADLLPGDAEAHGNLGNAYRASGRLECAVASHRRALDLAPGDAVRHNDCGTALLDLGRLEEAAASFRQAIALKPDFALAHGNLAQVLTLQNQIDEAEVCCRRALELSPALTSALVQLAELEAARGRFVVAEEVLRCALGIEPDMPEAWAGLVRWRKIVAGDPAWLAAALRVLEMKWPPRREVPLRFALGKYFDDLAQHEAAFGHFQRANALAKVSGPAYDRQAMTVSVDRLLAIQERRRLIPDEHRQSPDRGAVHQAGRPVLIVGMPRSGTTLAEQILASHPAVFGAGELPFWGRAAARYATAVSAGESGRQLLDRLAGEYSSVLNGLCGGALRVIDKMPGNFLYLGLIHAALPQARFIHLQRDPLDSCLSIYCQNFGAGHPYSSDLGDLAHYYAGYVGVMRHWRAELPSETLLEVSYEALVEQPEAQSRRMLDFLDLPWDPACLEFHRSSRPVSTLSKWQARQRIHNASVGRWRHYAQFLGPLRTLAGGERPGGAAVGMLPLWG